MNFCQLAANEIYYWAKEASTTTAHVPRISTAQPQ